MTPRQRRLLIALAAVVFVAIALLGWSIAATLRELRTSSPLSLPPTPILRPTLTPTPTSVPSPTPTPPFETAEAGAISEAVTQARGRLLRWEVPLTLLTRYDLSVALYERYQATPPFPLQDRRLLETLGLWPAEAVQPDVAVQAERVAALYVPEEGQLYLRRDWTGTADLLRAQLAYGYARALPDQYGDLPRLMATASFDRRLALLALGEGDAMVTLWRYAGVTPGSAAAVELQATIVSATVPAWRPAVPLLARIAGLPLTLGPHFVLSLTTTTEGGVLNEALNRPPRSTEQLLHPERYLAGDEPVVLEPVVPALKRGWELTLMETAGEALMEVTLETWAQGLAFTPTLTGWGGDLLQVWTGPQGAQVVLWQTAWDTGPDAVRFAAQVERLLPRRLGRVTDRTAAGTLPPGQWWGGTAGYAFLWRHADRVWVVWGPDQATVETIAAMAKSP